MSSAVKVIVVGYGSIGQRHARVLKSLGATVAVVSRRVVDVPLQYSDIAEAVTRFCPDYVVIAGRTSEHLDDLTALTQTGFAGAVLIEKPLFAMAATPPTNRFRRVSIGYNLRFHPMIRRLRDHLGQTAIHAVHAYAGQYLPDWRPDRDYRESYSARRAEGGGVLRDLSHELDYLLWMLGPWTRLTASGGHESALDIDSDDVFCLMAEMARCPHVTVTLNYLDRPARREIVALTSDGAIRVDLIAGVLEINGKTEQFTVDLDDTYRDEHRAAMDDDGADLCSLMEGIDVMDMIEAAETASREGRWIGSASAADRKARA